MSPPVLGRYEARVAAGAIASDAAQLAAVRRLDALVGALSRRRFRFWRKPAAPRGLYIWGEVGRGKSMLMDLLFEAAPLAAKRRVHFHAFMLEIHAALHEARRNGLDDPLHHVARQIARRVRLLCFDEFHVADIADASILGRLFTALFEAGVVVVATSNCAPDALYRGGLNRHRFEPFIATLKTRLDVLELDARHDYRLAALTAAPVWFAPQSDAARAALDARFAALTGGAPVQAARLDVSGRVFEIAETAAGVARLEFADLCDTARGAGDYLALARHFHTLMIDDIPVFDAPPTPAARRFATLIDALYEHKVNLLATADAPPDALYVGTQAGDFARTVSRLAEMGGTAYLAAPHVPLAPLARPS